MSGGQDNERLPSGWVETTISDLLAVLPDGRTLHQGWSPQCEKDPAAEGEWGVLKTTSVQDGSFLDMHNKRLPDHLKPDPSIEVRPGDILITCAGPRARCGVVSLVRSTRPSLMLSGKMYRFRVPNGKVEPAFVEAHLRTLESQHRIDRIKTGGSDSGLNLTHDRFRPLPLRLAPYNEQKRIVAKVEALQAHSDAAKEALDAIPDLVAQFRQSVLAAAFRGDLTKKWREANPDVEPASVLLERIRDERRRKWQKAHPNKKYVEPKPADTDGLPELPEGWCWASLEELVAGISYGHTASASSDTSGRKFLRITDLTDSGVNWESVPFCPDPGADHYDLKEGDIVVARTGATTGKSYRLIAPPRGAVFASYLIRLDALSSCPTDYIAGFMKGPLYWQQIMTVRKGSAQPGANASVLGSLAVPLCPRHEMEPIIRAANDVLADSSRIQGAAQAASDQLTSISQSILAKAFRGALVPQDPNDEPASVLLDRIRQERENGSSKPARKRRG
jgi:type I restriction enzyme S subunit